MSRSWYVLMVLVALLLASALVVATQSRSVNNGPTTFTTVAGNGKMGYSGDGGQATQASLRLPGAVAVGADRSLYIADTGSHRIRKVSPRGVITTVAGDGWRDGALLGRYAGDGGPATQASLDCPRGVAVGNDGSLYIADKHNHCIRKVTHDGVISTVAGTGRQGYSGDGGPAVQARLNGPCSVALGTHGELYIADTHNNCIRKVDSKGIVSTVAGTARAGYSGDGGPATKAQLNYPWGVAVSKDGSLYIADQRNQRVRKVGRDGVISTVAGTGRARYSGDGGQARKACLSFPQCVAVSADGSLLIADTHNFRIRKVDPTGFITTVVGSEVTDKAGLDWPGNVALGPDGSLYIADAQRCQVRKVAAAAGGHR